MTTVTVKPAVFTLVDYDSGTIKAIAEKLVADIGLGVSEVIVEVDETNPLGKVTLESADPLHITVESGAFEDPKRPRQLGRLSVADVLGGQFFQFKDRSDPAFGAPDDDDDLDLAYKVAWRIYSAARLSRLGYRAQRQRRLYHLRNRCGFSDATDEAFERLWTAEDLTWSDIVELIDRAEAARETATV
jgi:hypothetical protein